MRITKTKSILFCIILLAFFLRIYQLAQIPNSLDLDEAAFGYNAYSILKTGRDEFGHFLPIYLQSLDDYKSPLLSYVMIPFVKIWGLNIRSVRLPSAIFGTLTVWIFFKLTNTLFRNKKLALLCSLFAAISPWLIQYSRIGFDMQLSLFLSLWGIWLFLRAKEKPNFYYWSLLIMALAFYAYHASRFFVICFLPVLILWQRKFTRHLFIGLILLIILISPYINLYLNGKIGLRLFGISIFADQQVYFDQSQLILKEENQHLFGASFFHNRRLIFFNQFAKGYLMILNPNLLFAPNVENQMPLARHFYLWQLPLLAMGFVFIWKNFRLAWLIVVWLLIGFVPGGMTTLPVFDRRIILNSFPLILLIGIGFLGVINLFKSHYFFKKTLLIISLPIIISTAFYLHLYFIHGPGLSGRNMTNNMQELVRLADAEKNKYQKVVVSLKSEANIVFFLFYLMYPPEKYIAGGGTRSGGYLDERNTFNNYYFKFIKDSDMAKDTLYILDADEELPCLETLQTVNLADGTPFAKTAKFNPQLFKCKNSPK